MNPWRIALWAAIVAAALGFLWAVRGVLLPFVLAFLISVLLEPSVTKLEKRGVKRWLSVTVITVLFFTVVGGAVVLTAPIANQQFANVQKQVTEMTDQLATSEPGAGLTWVDRLLEETSAFTSKFGVQLDRERLVKEYIEPNSEEITKGIQGFFNGFVGIVTGAASQVLLLFFTPIFVVYLLLDMPSFRLRLRNWIPPTIRRYTMALLADIGDVFKSYLRGTMINVTVYTTVMTLLLAAFGVNSFMLLGLLIGTLYLIPGLGGFLASVVVWLIVGFSGQVGNAYLTMPSSWHFGAVIVGAMFVMGNIYDSFVSPRIIGGALNLHPMVGMFMVFSGGALFGLPGMLLAYPVGGSIKVILERLLRVSNSTADIVQLPAVPMRHRSAESLS